MTVSAASGRQLTFNVRALAAGVAGPGAADAVELRDWLVGYDLARPTGTLGGYELTEAGIEAARNAAELIEWIRT